MLLFTDQHERQGEQPMSRNICQREGILKKSLLLFTLFSIFIFAFIFAGQDDPGKSNYPPTALQGFEHLATLDGRLTERFGYGETPSGGYRLDVHFEGRLEGKINGIMKGIDYALIRPDYITELNVRGMIKTDDDALISVEITGFLVGKTSEIRDTRVKFQTGNPKYQWLHNKIIVGIGKSIEDEKILIKYYYLP